MLKNKVVEQEVRAVSRLTPDLLAKMRKEDMKQAIHERFSARAETVAPQVAVEAGGRSPYWQPADEEC
jgi:hypothetical protein